MCARVGNWYNQAVVCMRAGDPFYLSPGALDCQFALVDQDAAEAPDTLSESMLPEGLPACISNLLPPPSTRRSQPSTPKRHVIAPLHTLATTIPHSAERRVARSTFSPLTSPFSIARSLGCGIPEVLLSGTRDHDRDHDREPLASTTWTPETDEHDNVLCQLNYEL